MVVITELKTFPTLSRESLLLNNPKQEFSGKPNPDAENPVGVLLLLWGVSRTTFQKSASFVTHQRHPPARARRGTKTWNMNFWPLTLRRRRIKDEHDVDLEGRFL